MEELSMNKKEKMKRRNIFVTVLVTMLAFSLVLMTPVEVKAQVASGQTPAINLPYGLDSLVANVTFAMTNTTVTINYKGTNILVSAESANVQITTYQNGNVTSGVIYLNLQGCQVNAGSVQATIGYTNLNIQYSYAGNGIFDYSMSGNVNEPVWQWISDGIKTLIG